MRIIKFIILFFAISSQSQNLKLGKVTIDEVREKSCPSDSAASAAILFKKASVTFEVTPQGYWNLITITDVKIKIYKRDAYDMANVEKIYYSGSNDGNVWFSNAVTYNLVNGAVEKTKLKAEGEFTEQKDKFYKVKKISLPNVREGSVIEYSCRQETRMISEIPNFYFQYPIPAKYIEYQVFMPATLSYNVSMGGYLTPKKTVEVNVNGGNFNENRMTFILQNIKAMKDESYVNNINNYRSRIKFELSSQSLSNGNVENYATNWEAVANKIYDNDDFGRQLEKTNYFESDVNALLSGVTDSKEKTNLIFNFVQKRMNWNDYLGYSCDEGVKSAYNSKTGNSAEINLMLVGMLRYAGITANPVLVSTRSNGITIFPSRTAFNYVIAGVESPDGLMLFDATNKNTRANILPTRALNWVGRMIRKNGTSEEVFLMPKINSKEVINVLASIDVTGKATGKIRDQYVDYNAHNFREKYLGLTKDSYLEKLEKRYAGLNIEEYNVTNDNDLDKPILETYSFTHENVVEIIGDKMYFSPMLFLAQDENPFKQDVREFPVDFNFPFQDKYTISISLPDGYAIESIPKPVVYSMEDNIGTFKFNISATDKNVQLSIINEINKAIVGPEYYETLQTFFKEMIAKQNEKIVLKKV